jgi:hypothetical protein
MTSPAEAQRILQLLGTAVDFLGATGGAVLQSLSEGLGDMLLAKYLKTVLLVEGEIESRAIARQVCVSRLCMYAHAYAYAAIK